MLSLLCILSYKIQSFESCSPTCDEKTDDKFDDVAGQGAMERLGNANEKMRLMISNPLLTLNFVPFEIK